MLNKVPPVLPPELEDIVTRTIGGAIKVHRELGTGYSEGIYQDALRIELEIEAIPFECEVPVLIHYRGRPLRTQRLDFVVARKIVLELKAVDRLELGHQTQILSYMKAGGFRVGLLMNFHEHVLRAGLKRFVL